MTTLSDILKNHAGAELFCAHIFRVLHFWDDLVDRDKPVSDDDINAAMWTALIDMPRNPFYHQNFASLNSMLVNAIANWTAATKFERSNESLELAYVVRSDYVNLVIHCAYLVGGREWALEVTPQIRELWEPENFEQYKKSLADEASARERK